MCVNFFNMASFFSYSEMQISYYFFVYWNLYIFLDFFMLVFKSGLTLSNYGDLTLYWFASILFLIFFLHHDFLQAKLISRWAFKKSTYFYSFYVVWWILLILFVDGLLELIILMKRGGWWVLFVCEKLIFFKKS